MAKCGRLLIVAATLSGAIGCNNPVQPSCSFDLTTTTAAFQPAGGTGAATVTPNPGRSGCAWTASATGGFITLTGATSGSGQGSFGYTISANTSASNRSGEIVVEWSGDGTGSKRAAISQSGAPAEIILGTSSMSVSAGGEAGSIAVTSTVSWTATSNESWLAITSGASGTGNGTVNFNAAANSGGPRSATITISGGGQSAAVQVNQSAAPVAGAISLDPTSVNVPAAGQGGLTVAVSANVAWTATSNQGFVTITSGASGSGSGTVTYSVAANTGGARNATITVAGSGQTATLSIEQAAIPAQDSILLNPTSANVPAPGQTGQTIAVSANVSWTATSNQSFVTITSGATGTNNGTITYSVAANGGTTSRSATITVTGGGQTATFAIEQAGTAPPCGISLSPTAASVGPAGQTGLTTAVTAGCAWIATPSQGFVTITGGASGSGNGTITYNVAANTGQARSASITVSGGGTSATLTINQAGPSISLNPATQAAPVGGQNGLTTAVTANVAWSATSNQSWLTITGGATGSNNGTVTYNVAANSGQARSAIVTVSGGGASATLTVNQDGTTLTINPDTQAVAYQGQNGLTTAVTSNVSWTATPNQNWLTVASGGSGTGNGAITYDVASNAGNPARVGTITVTGGGITRTLTVNQASGVPSATITYTKTTQTSPGQCELTGQPATFTIECRFDAVVTGPQSLVTAYEFLMDRPGSFGPVTETLKAYSADSFVNRPTTGCGWPTNGSVNVTIRVNMQLSTGGVVAGTPLEIQVYRPIQC